MNVLVTGATGFVGKHYMAYPYNGHTYTTIDLRNTNWATANYTNYDAVVHLAGKAHDMACIDEAKYFEINTELTKQLYYKVKADGVKHFIYISSTKVYGNGSYNYFNEQSPCNPTDAYGKSKLQAEQFLLAQQGIAVAIIRPPLVYGNGVKGNMEKLITLCNTKSWLPFGGIHNARSMVYVGNLVALINVIITQKAAGIFVAGDGAAVSTTQLITTIAHHVHPKIKLITIPLILRSIIKIVKPNLYIRLFGSFNVDNAYTLNHLNHKPPFTFNQGIGFTVK